MSMSNEPDPRSRAPIDFDEVERLVEALERDLARARAGSGDVETLREEVRALSQALAARRATGDDLDDGMHGRLTNVRSLLHRMSDELATDTVIAGDYVTRIGRILGLV